MVGAGPAGQAAIWFLGALSQVRLSGEQTGGAEFLAPPKVHSREIRCSLRHPDGHLIEVGHTTGLPT